MLGTACIQAKDKAKLVPLLSRMWGNARLCAALLLVAAGQVDTVQPGRGIGLQPV